MSHIDTTLAAPREADLTPLHGRTIEDVIQAIATLPGLTPRTRSDYKSALRTVARAIGQLPNAIPANPPAITRRLKGFKAAELDLKPASWNNAISISRKAFKATGCFVAPGAYNTPFAPVWAALAKKIKATLCATASPLHARRVSEKGWQPKTSRTAISSNTKPSSRRGWPARAASVKPSEHANSGTRRCARFRDGRTLPVRTVKGPAGLLFPWSAFPRL
jgi:hypothetical protein